MYLKENYNSIDKFLTYFAVYGILKYIGGSIMVKIAVCDDEQNALEEISERILNFFNKKENRQIKYKVSLFSTGGELVKAGLTTFDIVFLDVELGDSDGLEIAKQIHGVSNRTIVILISQYQDYMSLGYHVKAFRYILKPNLNSVFDVDIDSALDELNLKRNVFEYTYYNIPYEVEYDNILYFQGADPKVYIHTLNHIEQDSISGNIDDIYPQFLDTDFVRIGKSYLINGNHVKNMSNTAVYMDNDVEIKIGRGYMNEARDKLIRIMRDKRWKV